MTNASEIPHRFRDESLYRLAMTHASTGRSEDNERLEFLGDAVLDLIVAEDLFRAHGDVSEGELTELKAWAVSRPTLAQAARGLGLASRVQLGPGLRGRTLSDGVLADLYEALLGAVYLDGGLEAARVFAHRTLEDPLEKARNLEGGPNPKQAFQHLSQSMTGEPPTYVLLEERGDAHAKAFRVAAELDGRRFPGAWGRTRKEAERWAAHEALLVLGEEDGPEEPR